MPMAEGNHSPPTKKIKLEELASDLDNEIDKDDAGVLDTEDDEVDQCSICLQPLSDRTVIPICSHEFCFECLLVWTEQSRRCPLCSRDIGEYVIHNIRSIYDFQKHYLTPLRTSPRPEPSMLRVAGPSRQTRRRDIRWGRSDTRQRERELQAVDELERAIEKRRWVYRHGLYAKHVASNTFTRYRPFPTPAQFTANPDLISRATIFVRRELRVWDSLDVEFLIMFTISLMKSLDIRSEPAVKLLAEFLDMDAEYENPSHGRNRGPRANAEHFAHELYCYLRSPYRDLSVYDTVVQYDTPEEFQPQQIHQRSRRWVERPRTRSRSSSPPQSRSHTHQHPRDVVRGMPSPDRDGRKGYSIPPSFPHLASTSQRRLSVDPEQSLETITSAQLEPHHVATLGSNVKGKQRVMDVNLTTTPSSRHRDTNSSSPQKRSDHDHNLFPASNEIRATRRPSYSSHSQSPRSHTHTSPAVSASTKNIATNGEYEPDLRPGVPAQSDVMAKTQEKLRPKIQRDALESMQIHLAKPPRSERQRTGNSATHSNANGGTNEYFEPPQQQVAELSIRGASKAADNKALPLASRLSDPIPTLDYQSNSSNSMDVTPTLSTPVSTPVRSVPKLSAPEIMAKTRAKLSRLKKDTMVNEDSPLESCVNAGLPSPHDTEESHPTDATQAFEDNDAAIRRMKLLRKLQDERKRQADVNGSKPYEPGHEDDLKRVDETETVNATPHDFSPTNSTLKHPTAAETVEAKLRSQAQLRARLAAAKKVAEQGKGPQDTM